MEQATFLRGTDAQAFGGSLQGGTTKPPGLAFIRKTLQWARLADK